MQILSSKPSEPIKIDEMLKQDARTFITAFSTAFVLNGAKALIVELKGEKYQLTPEDFEKCIDEDGKIDTERLMEYLYSNKKKIPLRSNYNNPKDSINNAETLYKKFLYKHGSARYMPGTIQLKKALENTTVYSSDKEFENKYAELGGTGNVKTVAGFNYMGKTFLRKDVSYLVVIHELTHSLGNVDGTTRQGISDTGINEAMTDAIANDIGGEVGQSSYLKGAEAVADINKELFRITGDNLLYESYYSSNKTAFKTALNSIMEDNNFYDNLAEQMEISRNGNSSFRQRNEANKSIDKMVDQFLFKARKIK